MAEPTEANIVMVWLNECGRIDPIYSFKTGVNPTGRWEHSGRRSVQTRTPWGVRINEDGHLIYVQRVSNENSRTVEMARFVGERRMIDQQGGCVLLNGDGFSEELSPLQTRIRDRTRRKFKMANTLIVPYMALTAAEIDYDSILLIHATGDTWTDLKTPLKTPKKGEREEPERRNSAQVIFVWDRRQWRTVRTRDNTILLQVMHQPLNGAPDWHDVVHPNSSNAYITERIHNLGSSVFSAVGPDGERHRYISAFDSQETRPMYFLAQLPDEGKCEKYTDALHLLAPPIVHQARREGRRVFRQGDIFAIQTDLSDLFFSTDPGCRIVRRAHAFNGNGTLMASRRKRIRKDLMIYGTGHTADLVAVRENGATFIKGTMFHDPVLETEGRTREHRDVALSPKNSWFFCCRNTVPRAIKREEADVNSGS